jgi:hypothetical protein
MTVDALLNIFLSVCVPGLMALIGGILAARALPSKDDKRNPELYLWASGFLLLFVVSLILAFIQQVRITTQQAESVKEVHEKELKSNGDIKYMQGELDSIGNVLKVSGQGDPATVASILKSITVSTTRGVEAPAIERMTNQQLRAKVIEFARALRKECDNYTSQVEFSTIAQRGQAKVLSQEEGKKLWQEDVNRGIAMSNSLNLRLQQNFVGDANQYKNELLRRLGPQNSLLPSEQTFWIGGNAVSVGYWQARGTADYLEGLAKRLP